MTKPKIIINYPVGVPIHQTQILVNGIDITQDQHAIKLEFTMESGSAPKLRVDYVGEFENKIGQICGDKEKDLTG